MSAGRWLPFVAGVVALSSCGRLLEPGAIPIPSQAPYDQWTYVPFDDAFCANGSPIGIEVNPHSGSRNLFIYLAGGGACWDYATCVAQPLASNLNGIADPAATLQAGLAGQDMFDRLDASNPYRNDNFVVIPYCTGDTHAGNHVMAYSSGDGGTTVIEHVGYANVTAFLRRLVPTFRDAQRVVIAGTSAGGYGAAFNYGRIREAFPGAQAFLVDDSGPTLRTPYFTRTWYEAQNSAWRDGANLPAGCPECQPDAPDGGVWNLFPYYARDPSFRGALIATTRDQVISFFGAVPPGNPNSICSADGGGPCEYQAGLTDLVQNVLEPAAPGQVRVYVIDSSAHGAMPGMVGQTSNGVSLEAWLAGQVSGSGWSDVLPP